MPRRHNVLVYTEHKTKYGTYMYIVSNEMRYVLSNENLFFHLKGIFGILPKCYRTIVGVNVEYLPQIVGGCTFYNFYS